MRIFIGTIVLVASMMLIGCEKKTENKPVTLGESPASVQMAEEVGQDDNTAYGEDEYGRPKKHERKHRFFHRRK